MESVGTSHGTHATEPPSKQLQPKSDTTFAITGMTCSNCARHVREAILGVAGVSGAEVDLEGQSASVRWAADARPLPSAVIHAVAQAGYEAKLLDAPQQ